MFHYTIGKVIYYIMYRKHTVRPMQAADKPRVMAMMRVFYASPAVSINGSEEIFSADIDACVSDNPYAEGYVIECDEETAGYAMLAKSWSTEFGKPCIWIEDIYLQDTFRGKGLGKLFFNFLTDKYEGCLFRLEVEAENEQALQLYKKCGFDFLPYLEMKKP